METNDDSNDQNRPRRSKRRHNRKRARLSEHDESNNNQGQEFPGFQEPRAKRKKPLPQRQNKQGKRQAASRPKQRRGTNKRGRLKNGKKESTAADCKQTLQWQTTHPHVPLDSETRMLPKLMLNGKKERKMIWMFGKNRCKEIHKQCKQVGMQLSQALSLRRQYIRHLNPTIPMKALRLGHDDDIRQSAALFEETVESYLNQCHLSFLTEQQQRAAIPKGAKMPPSPDFMMAEPTLLQSIVPSNVSESSAPKVDSHVVHWIEAKMFYGGSCIANNSLSAVGMILGRAEKYVRLYGSGAMVFMYGCGKEMAELLLERGVVALDAHPLDLRPVEDHQRTWCANKEGVILP